MLSLLKKDKRMRLLMIGIFFGADLVASVNSGRLSNDALIGLGLLWFFLIVGRVIQNPKMILNLQKQMKSGQSADNISWLDTGLNTGLDAGESSSTLNGYISKKRTQTVTGEKINPFSISGK